MEGLTKLAVNGFDAIETLMEEGTVENNSL